MIDDITGMEFCDIISASLSGQFCERVKAANERRKKRIQEIGYEAYHNEYEARKNQILYEATLKGNVENAKNLLIMSKLGKRFFQRTLENFRVNDNNQYAFDVCCDIANGKRVKGVILSGSHGIGKTHLAAGIINKMASEGQKAYFGNITDIISEVMDNLKSGTDKVISRFLDGKLLVIDDLGAENSSNMSMEILYKIINRAYEGNKIIIITTNLSEYEFTARYGIRISSRLHEMSEWIRYSDDDNRLEFVKSTEPTPFN